MAHDSGNMRVRRAVEADIPALLGMAERFLAGESYRGVIAFVPERLENLFRQLGSSEATLLLVAEHGGQIVGMIAFAVYPHPFSGEIVGGEVFWWSERRGAGGALLEAAEMWARQRGAQILQMVAPTETVGRIYQKRGYRLIESNWQRRV